MCVCVCERDDWFGWGGRGEGRMRGEEGRTAWLVWVVFGWMLGGWVGGGSGLRWNGRLLGVRDGVVGR